MSQRENIYAVIVYSKKASYREQFKQYIDVSRKHEKFYDFINNSDIIYCKNLREMVVFKKKYSYSLIILDMLSEEESLTDLVDYLPDFPGFRDVSYKHFTFIRTNKIDDNLRGFLLEIPVCFIGNNAELSPKQASLGLTLLTELYGAKISHPSLMKFFELYHNGQYKNAFEIARIFHRRHPDREFLYWLLQSANLTLHYMDEDLNSSDIVKSVFDSKSKMGILNFKKDLIAARDYFRNKKSVEARKLFQKTLSKLGGSDSSNITNSVLWLIEKFVIASKYTVNKEEMNRLNTCIDLAVILEPELSVKNLNFSTISMNDINKSVFNCRLGAELAILSNVVAYYCSDIKNYSLAAKLYAAAYCFSYNNRDFQLAVLRNLERTYRKLGNDTNREITIDMIVECNGSLPDFDSEDVAFIYDKAL